MPRYRDFSSLIVRGSIIASCNNIVSVEELYVDAFCKRLLSRHKQRADSAIVCLY